MEINEKNIKMWSIIGPRATVGLTALDLAKKAAISTTTLRWSSAENTTSGLIIFR